MDAPDDLTWHVTIPPDEEPGEKLIIDGTVYEPDGWTPAKGAIIYVYHTNAQGIYPTKGDETGNGQRHGYLRGWMETGADGLYRFTTIRPGGYPGREDPQHIHITVTAPGEDEYWLDSYWFADDERITKKMHSRLERPGDGSNIIELTRDDKGVWHGSRDIVLPEM